MEFLEFVFLGLSLFISFVLHELSHALAAYYLGDPTAKLAGRLSLNPFVHLDLVGTLVFLVTKTIGWAKPVPVNSANFKKPVRDMALTAFAGPFSNLILAFVAAWFLKYLKMNVAIYANFVFFDEFVLFFTYFFHVNVALAVFNLLPFPPLDGSKIVGVFVPSAYRRQYLNFLYKGNKYFLAIILIDVFILGRFVGFSVFGFVMRFLMSQVELLLLLGT